MAKGVKTSHQANTTKPIESYATSKEDIVEYLNDVKVIDVFGKVCGISENETVVIAKLPDGTLYPTGKSYAGTKLLDPYKMYNRMKAEKIDGKYHFSKI